MRMNLGYVHVVIYVPVYFLLCDGRTIIRQDDLELHILVCCGIQRNETQKRVHGVAAGFRRLHMLAGYEVVRVGVVSKLKGEASFFLGNFFLAAPCYNVVPEYQQTLQRSSR